MRIWIRTEYDGLRLAACIGDKMHEEDEEEHDWGYRWGSSTCDCRHIKHKIVCQTRMRNGKAAKKYGCQAGRLAKGGVVAAAAAVKRCIIIYAHASHGVCHLIRV